MFSARKPARTPVFTDQVRVLYRGTLLDGTELDSAPDPDAPAM